MLKIPWRAPAVGFGVQSLGRLSKGNDEKGTFWPDIIVSLYKKELKMFKVL